MVVLAQIPDWLWLAYAMAIGATLGSFVNVVVARLPTGESVVRPRSRCPSCKTPIAWYDNLPILSWILLRARCRKCGTRISARYVTVELIMTLLAGALFLRLGPSLQLVFWIPLSAALLAIVFLDIDHFWVPDVITYPAMLYAALGALLPGGLGLAQALFGLLPALLIWAFAVIFEKLAGKEGLGLGDVKLLAVIGLALGALPTLTVLFLGSVQGSVVGVLTMLTGGHAPRPAPVSDDGWVPPPRAIPFGPFLILGCFEVLLLPDVFGALPELLQRWVLS